MVLDLFTNAQQYASISPRIAEAIAYVRATDFSKLADGKHIVDGDRIFALVQRYPPKPITEGRWEAHRKYIDLQVVLGGEEQIGYASIDQLRAEPYDAEKDLIWLSGTAGQWLTVPAGHFMLLWPGDAHMPGIQTGRAGDVFKVVVKIAL